MPEMQQNHDYILQKYWTFKNLERILNRIYYRCSCKDIKNNQIYIYSQNACMCGYIQDINDYIK